MDEADRAYLYAELDRANERMPEASHLATMQTQCRGLVLGMEASARTVADAAELALLARKPFSAVRLGDGEANILGMRMPDGAPEREMFWFNAIFRHQIGKTLEAQEATAFAETMRQAFLGADVLGTRILEPNPRTGWPFRYELDAETWIERVGIRGALGIVRAKTLVLDWLAEGLLTDSTLTHAWFYTPLLAHLDRLAGAARRVRIISGRVEVFDALRARFAGVPTAFLPIPVEVRYLGDGEATHYPEAYERTLAALRGDLAGELVLVGAGIFGKAFCHAAKASGGVAIDLGSGFDILAGKRTRPAHDAAKIEAHRLI